MLRVSRFFAGIGLFACCALRLGAAPTLTTIQDTLYTADGTLLNGVVIITWPSFVAADGSAIAAQTLTVPVPSGYFQVALVPTVGASTTVAYSVRINSAGKNQSTELWSVPQSSTPLSIQQVMIVQTGGIIVGSIGSGGTGTINDTAIPITDVVGLSNELTMRPMMGPAFADSRAAIINSTGGIDAATGNLSDCVHVDGSSGSCGGSSSTTSTASFVDAEVPAGTINGSNTQFNLSQTPSPTSSVAVWRNGLYLNSGVDFTISGNAITFAASSTPLAGDSIVATYRTGTGGSGLNPSAASVAAAIGCPSASGSATTYTCPATLAAACTEGMTVYWTPDVTSGAAPTLNAGCGAKAIHTNENAAAATGLFTAGAQIPVWFDGTEWRAPAVVPRMSGGTATGDVSIGTAFPVLAADGKGTYTIAAPCTGSGDDTAAINTSLAEAVAAGSATALFPFGSCRISGRLTINGATDLRVVGQGTRITQTASDTPMFVISDSTKVDIAGFDLYGLGTDYVDSASSATNAVLVYIVSSAGVNVHDDLLENFGEGGVMIQTSSNITVDRCTIIGPGSGVIPQGGTGNFGILTNDAGAGYGNYRFTNLNISGVATGFFLGNDFSGVIESNDQIAVVGQTCSYMYATGVQINDVQCDATGAGPSGAGVAFRLNWNNTLNGTDNQVTNSTFTGGDLAFTNLSGSTMHFVRPVIDNVTVAGVSSPVVIVNNTIGGAGLPTAYVPGGTSTFSGSGTCVYTASSGFGGTGANINVTVTAGVVTGFPSYSGANGSTGAGSAYTSQPTSWTWFSGSACSSGTMDTSGGAVITSATYDAVDVSVRNVVVSATAGHGIRLGGAGVISNNLIDGAPWSCVYLTGETWDVFGNNLNNCGNGNSGGAANQSGFFINANTVFLHENVMGASPDALDAVYNGSGSTLTDWHNIFPTSLGVSSAGTRYPFVSDTSYVIGENAGKFCLYNVGDPTLTNWEDACLNASSNVYRWQNSAGGTGVSRDMALNAYGIGDFLYEHVSTGIVDVGTATYGANAPGHFTFNGSPIVELGVKFTTTHGTNATSGTATLSGGTATVSTSAIGALASPGGSGDVVSLTLESCSSCGALSVGAVTAGTSFVVNSTNASDGSTVFWQIQHIN
jgi:hypothetical protein